MNEHLRPKYDYVVIEGNIGSGKTSLAHLVAQRWNARLMLERFSDNPFLPKFYENPKRHAFTLELSFLADRYNQNREELSRIDLFQPTVVSDYSFAKSLIFAGINLQEDEFELYRTLFHIIHGRLPKPDLLVYLHCSVDKSLRQIQKRGRSFEQDITSDYLTQITKGYLEFFRQLSDVPIVILDTERIDFVNSNRDFASVLSVIETKHPTGMTTLSL